MWGIETATGWTAEGSATMCITVDHFTAKCLGIRAARLDRCFEALEPLRQGIDEHFDAHRADVATGLARHHDHDSQFLRNLFQTELRFLWIECFETVEALRRVRLVFKDRYNREWLIERHEHQSPAAIGAASDAETAT